MLRSVPANSTIVGVPGHIVLCDGKRVVITDPKDIRDPLSDVIIKLAAEVHELREKFQHIESLAELTEIAADHLVTCDTAVAQRSAPGVR